MVGLTGSAIEVGDAGDISRAALRLVEETRCAVWRGCLLGLGVLAGRKSKRRSGEENDGGGDLHIGGMIECLWESCESVCEKVDDVLRIKFKWPSKRPLI